MSEALKPNVLVLPRRGTKPFFVDLFDENDQPEDLATADRAIVRVLEHVGGPEVLVRRTTADNLSIDKPNHRLVGSLSGAEADALVPGVYPAQASVRFGGDDDAWFFTEYFQVQIVDALADKT